jgi:arylsulfatase A-like enzyme
VRLFAHAREFHRHPAAGAVAGAFVYLAAATLGFKLARAAQLASDIGSARPFAVLPPALSVDLLVVAGGVLLVWGAAVAAGRRAATAAAVVLELFVGVMAALNLVSYRVVGAPLTWQTVRGDEGGTVGDLDLLSGLDLGIGIALLAAALLLAWPAHWLGNRLKRFLARPAMPASLLVLSMLCFAAGRVLPGTGFGLDTVPAVELVLSVFDGEPDRRGGVRLTERDWRALHRPLTTPRRPDRPVARTGFVPRNAVIFVAEGIPFDMTSFGLPEQDPTPFLRGRAERDGVVFTRYHANWHSSIQALFALACSEYPTTDVRYRSIVTLNPRIDCGELSELMRAGGIHAGLFHAGDFAFYDKLGFFGGRGYEATVDAETMVRRYGIERSKWGVDDRVMSRAVLDWVDSLPRGERFAALMITLNPHYPYTLPAGTEKPFPGKGKRERFLNAIAFNDRVFEELLRAFEKRGRYRDTLFIWLADHGNVIAAHGRPTPGSRGFYQDNLHVPLVLLNPRLFPGGGEGAPRLSARLGSHVDLLPTVLDLLGLPPDPRHRGQSLVSPRYVPRRVFFGAFISRRTYVGLLEGPYKVALDIRQDRLEYYDLDEDPDERNDLGADHPGRMARYRRDLDRFFRGMLHWIPSRPSRSGRHHVFDTVFREAAVRIKTGKGTHRCPPVSSGKARTCEGLGDREVILDRTVKIGRDRPRCMLLRLPEGTRNARVTIRGPVLNAMSSVRFGVPKEDANEAYEGVVRVDGARASKVSFGRRNRLTKVAYPRAGKELAFVVRPRNGAAGRVCLVLSDAAWRNQRDDR